MCVVINILTRINTATCATNIIKIFTIIFVLEYSKEFTSFLVSTMDYYNQLIRSVQYNYNFTLSIVDNTDSIQSESEQRKVLSIPFNQSVAM